MADRRTQLPRTGSSTEMLREHLTKIQVWKLLYLYIHGTLGTAATHRRLAKIGVEIEADEVGQLADLAFIEARPVGF